MIDFEPCTSHVLASASNQQAKAFLLYLIVTKLFCSLCTRFCNNHDFYIVAKLNWPRTETNPKPNMWTAGTRQLPSG
jgi:fumarate reductase subunit D